MPKKTPSPEALTAAESLHARWVAAFGPNEATRPGWEFLAEISPSKLPG